jgi:PAS domain S-box-containing protein
MTNPDNTCGFVNKVWLEFTGRTLSQECGYGWTEGIHPEDRDHVRTCLVSISQRQPFEVEYRLRRRDGEYRWVLSRGIPRYSSSREFLGYIGSAIDVNDRRGAEESDRRLMQAARLANLGQLTAIVSHEINQPLCAILTNAEAADLLLQGSTPPIPEVRRMLSDICREDIRASEVIRLARTLTHKQGPQMVPIQLNQLIKDILGLVSGDAARRRVSIRETLAADLPLVIGNMTSLEQVLLNLVMNAMDAMSEVSQHDRELTVSSMLYGDGRVVVTVTDRGPGIAPDAMPRLFESFFTTKPGGLGLGLPTARLIVTAHKGRIWAENAIDGGATFYIALPSAPSLHQRESSDGAPWSDTGPVSARIA